MERVRLGRPTNEQLEAFQWTAHNDARNIVLLGDPAVYLRGVRAPGPPRGKRPRVFLSYASENRVLANRIRNGLIEREIDVWIDTDPVDGIPAGASIDQELKRRVEQSDFAILCLSTQSVSKIGTVQKEWRWAVDHQRKCPDGRVFVIPVKLNRCVSPEWQRTLDLSHLELRRDRKGRQEDLDKLARHMLRLFRQSKKAERE
jgi:hypothetical protein